MRVPLYLKDDRGGVVLVFALAAPLLATAVATAVDYSDASRLHTKLQLVADQAALAGVLDLDPNSKATEAAAKARAGAVVSSQAPDVTQIIQANATDRTVVVSLSVTKKLLFGGILTPGAMNVGVAATGIKAQTTFPCMLALGADEPVGIELVGSASISAPKCMVESNALAQGLRLQGAPKLNAEKVCAAGNIGSTKTSPPPENCKPGTDPYKSRQLQQTHGHSTKIPGVASTYTGPCDHTNKSIPNNLKITTTLLPGVYCGGLSIGSSDVVLLPGLYTMQDGPLKMQGSGKLTGSGVSILLSGANAVLDLQGSPTFSLEAMQTGPLAGIALASDTPATPILTSSLQGSPDVTVKGSIYLPGQRLDLQGSPKLLLTGLTDTLMALSFKLQGSPDIGIASDTSKMNTNASEVRIAR